MVKKILKKSGHNLTKKWSKMVADKIVFETSQKGVKEESNQSSQIQRNKKGR